MINAALEKHYRVSEIAVLWNVSQGTIIKLFCEEEGVLKIMSALSGRRKYETLLIPESVIVRVHERLGQKRQNVKIPFSKPLRVIRLRDLK